MGVKEVSGDWGHGRSWPDRWPGIDRVGWLFSEEEEEVCKDWPPGKDDDPVKWPHPDPPSQDKVGGR